MKILLVSGGASQTPVIDVMPETAVLRRGFPLFVPDFADQWRLSLGVGVRIERLGKSIGREFAHRYYTDFILALRLVPVGQTVPVGFDDSVMAGRVADIPSTVKLETSPLYMQSEGSELIDSVELPVNADAYAIENAIEDVSRYFVLHTGDMVLLESGIEVLCPAADCRLRLLAGNAEVLTHKIKAV